MANAIIAKHGNSSYEILLIRPFECYMEGIITLSFALWCHRYTHGKEITTELLAALTLAHIKSAEMHLGRVCVDVERLLGELMDKRKLYGVLEAGSSDWAEAIEELEKSERIVIDRSVVPGASYVYSAWSYKQEIKIEGRMDRIMNEPKSTNIGKAAVLKFLKEFKEVALDEVQQAAVVSAVTSPVMALVGGPGTGKTQTLKAVAECIRACAPGAKISLLAPTGRAAQRMAEQIGLPASTIHKALGLLEWRRVDPQPLGADYVIVDECSMIGDELFSLLLSAVQNEARLVLVGDTDQLPPIDIGLPLLDIIASGAVQVVRLERTYRQEAGSGIIDAARSVLSGRALVYDNSSVKAYPCVSADTVSMVCKVYKAALKAGYKVDDVQVLAPLKGTGCGVHELNRALQEMLNPDGASYTYKDVEFRKGDRVIHMVNNYELMVMNGEVGVISEICGERSAALVVQYPDRSVCYSPGDLKELDLAYAISVHKSQGQEYPVVILPACEAMRNGYTKKLIYTGLTRAKKRVCVVGAPWILDEQASVEGREDRCSCLTVRLSKLRKENTKQGGNKK